MKYILLLWFLYCTTSFVQSQTITIKDKSTGKPLEMVILISESPQIIATTNASGQAELNLFKGVERIEIRLSGYQPEVKSYMELENQLFEVWLTYSPIWFDEVVVASARWNQFSKNMPSKIATISKKEVAFYHPQTAADLLELSGKVFVQKSQQGGGSPMIRGFATNRLLYAVDGVRMNTAIYRSGNIQNVINLDPFATEKTEIVFGTGSVIYGSDAIGGVMSFQSISPQFSFSDEPLITGKAVARYASANQENTGHFDVNIGWKNWSVLTSFSSWDFDHLKQGNYGPDDYIKSIYVERQDSIDVIINQEDPLLQIPTAYSQMNIMQKVRFKPDAHWDFQYAFHYSITSPYGRYDRHNRMKNVTPRYSEWNYGPQLWMMHHFNITHQGKMWLYDQLSIKLAQQKFEESRIDRSLNSNERNTQSEQVKANSLNLDFIKSIQPRNTLLYGFEYVFNDVASSGLLTDIVSGVSQTGPSRYPQSTWNSLAAYISNDFKVSRILNMQAGMRYNQYQLNGDFSNNLAFYPFPFKTVGIQNSALTGTLGAVFKPSESMVVRSNLGTAFRSPNVDDIGKVFDSSPGSVTVPNPNLEAEYAYNFDFGITKLFGDVFKMDLSAFYTVLQQALVLRPYTLNGQDSILYDGQMSEVQAIQNAAKANVYGLQLGLEWKLPAGFMVLTDMNYQVGEEELIDGSMNASRHAAPFFGVGRLRYQTKKLWLECYINYQAEKSFSNLALEEQQKDEIYAKDQQGNNYSPQWYTLNLKAQYILTEKFSISAGIENITDQRYRMYSSGISGAGRNFILSVKAAF